MKSGPRHDTKYSQAPNGTPKFQLRHIHGDPPRLLPTASCHMIPGFLPLGLGRLAPGVGQDASLAIISEITPHKRVVENQELVLVETCKNDQSLLPSMCL